MVKSSTPVSVGEHTVRFAQRRQGDQFLTYGEVSFATANVDGWVSLGKPWSTPPTTEEIQEACVRALSGVEAGELRIGNGFCTACDDFVGIVIFEGRLACRKCKANPLMGSSEIETIKEQL